MIRSHRFNTILRVATCFAWLLLICAEHCLDIIRQSIQCSWSNTLIPPRFSEGLHHNYIDSDQVHTCRSFTFSRDWMDSRHYEWANYVERDLSLVDERKFRIANEFAREQDGDHVEGGPVPRSDWPRLYSREMVSAKRPCLGSMAVLVVQLWRKPNLILSVVTLETVLNPLDRLASHCQLRSCLFTAHNYYPRIMLPALFTLRLFHLKVLLQCTKVEP